LDNWIGIKEKATGRIKPLIAYQPGQSVTITLIHATEPLESKPIQIDFYYSPPQSTKALKVGSIIVDQDSLIQTGTKKKDKQIELNLTIDKSRNLHAALKAAHNQAPVFPFIISQAQMYKYRKKLKFPAGKTIVTKDSPVPNLTRHSGTYSPQIVKTKLKQFDTTTPNTTPLFSSFSFFKFFTMLLAVFILVCSILFLFSQFFPSVYIPYFSDLFKILI
jgi:hypothetical protein